MIRRFRAQDAAAVSTLHANTIRKINKGDYSEDQIEPWASHSSPQLFIDSMFELVRFVADYAGRIVGFADYKPETGQVTGLYVSADHQRSGYGKQLYAALESDARRRKIPKLWLESTLTAAPFYEAMGYVRTSQVRVVEKHNIEMIRMEKSLGGE
ncbi:MAG: GNAT family N-acetyltransferase [Candidatus Woesearchaeota archaeon]